MNRRNRRRTQALQAKNQLGVKGLQAHTAQPQTGMVRGRLQSRDRKALLLGTALASTLLLGALVVPTPAAAVVTCAAFDGTGPAPILLPGTNDSIVCVNTEARTGVPYAIQLSTIADNQSIELNTIGTLSASGAGEAFGIFAETDGANSGITIDNAGDVTSTGDAGLSNDAYAIYARANGDNSNITIDNTGDLAATTVGDASTASGIYAFSAGVNNDIAIHNAGDITAATGGDGSTAYGIYAGTFLANADVTIHNTGDIAAATDADLSDAFGIFTETDDANSSITIDNSGDIAAASVGSSFAHGVRAATYGTNSDIEIDNTGDIAATTAGGADLSYAFGIRAYTGGGNSDTKIVNSGDIIATDSGDDGGAYGISAFADTGDSSITIYNSGDIAAATDGDESDAFGIFTRANLDNSPITIDNTGDITVTGAGGGYAHGIRVITYGTNSTISIDNTGDITATKAGGVPSSDAFGIRAYTAGSNSDTGIDNSGDIVATASGDDSEAFGIAAFANDGNVGNVNSNIIIHNRGDIAATTSGAERDTYGIFARTDLANGNITIGNSGDITATSATGYAFGISARTVLANSAVSIDNSGDVTVAAGGDDYENFGIFATTEGADGDITVHNTGDLAATGRGENNNAFGIFADADGAYSPIAIHNTGDITVTADGENGDAYGIVARTSLVNSHITIHNAGDLTATAIGDNPKSAYAIEATTFGGGANSSIRIHNTGCLTATATGFASDAYGVKARTRADASSINIVNAGGISSTVSGNSTSNAYGLFTETDGDNSDIGIHNTGDITAIASGDIGIAYGIRASTGDSFFSLGDSSAIAIYNAGDVDASAGGYSYGIFAVSYGADGAIAIENAGSVNGGTAGIRAYSRYAAPKTIVNTGDISAGSHLAIDVDGTGTAKILNAGLIIGFVDLTDQDDVFENRSGGVFETKKTSFFGGGDDLFVNEEGGAVLAATDATKSEKSAFEGLETFENAGLISMVDGRAGDSFTLSNTPGGTYLDYKGNGGTLGVDAFLGGPGSKSDIFTIEGDVSGKTAVAVNNTNAGPGVFNAKGIPVVFATGETPSANGFRLQDGPIDTGFFDYDLFFKEGGSGQWELRSFAGGGAHLLPQLLTAAQDIWHQSSSTWFDRTADLRVLMHGGPAPIADGGKSLAAPVQDQLTPAVWLQGGGSWLDRDANAQTRAYGRNYKFNLDRELETFDVQAGIDFGQRDVMGAGDALVFGVLGGFVHGDLDYDGIARSFQYSGGQVGAYATYLSGGLFVDTLLSAHIYELDADNVAFPGSIDGNTVGLRTDAGYRFGGFSGGAFIEPLATIEVMWADIDGFSAGGNRVSFDDEANVRGRLGLRAGTTREVWEGTLMEPFIVGSLWGNLSDDNQATLVSSGRTFRFQDNLEDVWGEVSAGVNFFNFSQTTSLFGKVDVQFGDDISGVGGKAGMRVAW